MEIVDIIGVRRATLRTSMNADAAVAALGEHIDNPLELFGKKPLIGMVSAKKASFRRRLGYRNSWQSVMDVNFEPTGATTVMRVGSYMHPLAAVFMLAWIAIVLSMAVGMAGQEGISAVGTLIPIGMAVFGVAMTVFGRWLARNDHARMLDVVVQATNATVVDAEGYQPSPPQRAQESDGDFNLFSRQNLPIFIVLWVLTLGAVGVMFYFFGD